MASHGGCETCSQAISQVGLEALSVVVRVPQSRATFEVVLANWKANSHATSLRPLIRHLNANYTAPFEARSIELPRNGSHGQLIAGNALCRDCGRAESFSTRDKNASLL